MIRPNRYKSRLDFVRREMLLLAVKDLVEVGAAVTHRNIALYWGAPLATITKDIKKLDLGDEIKKLGEELENSSSEQDASGTVRDSNGQTAGDGLDPTDLVKSSEEDGTEGGGGGEGDLEGGEPRGSNTGGCRRYTPRRIGGRVEMVGKVIEMVEDGG